MQTLGIADSTPSSDNRLKSLFWPSITSGADVDYLGTQGYWVCTAVAVLTFLVLYIGGNSFDALLLFLFYYVGGIGVRERSLWAANAVFAMYALDLFYGRIGVVQILICALLVSNVRATYLARSWTPGSEQAELPPRLGATLGDKLADRFPMWCWPKIRVAYYIGSSGLLLIILLSTAILLLKHRVTIRP